MNPLNHSGLRDSSFLFHDYFSLFFSSYYRRGKTHRGCLEVSLPVVTCQLSVPVRGDGFHEMTHLFLIGIGGIVLFQRSSPGILPEDSRNVAAADGIYTSCGKSILRFLVKNLGDFRALSSVLRSLTFSIMALVTAFSVSMRFTQFLVIHPSIGVHFHCVLALFLSIRFLYNLYGFFLSSCSVGLKLLTLLV